VFGKKRMALCWSLWNEKKNEVQQQVASACQANIPTAELSHLGQIV